jgi:hypothetical protein
MKKLILLLLLSLNSLADPYNVKLYNNGVKGIIALDMPLLEGWKISPSKDHGDYLISNNNSVYFTATLMTGLVNDKNKTLSLADFVETRRLEHSKKHLINDVDIYTNFNGSLSEIENFAFSKFYKDGVALYATMIPYPEFKSKSLEEEANDLIEMLSQAELSEEVLAEKNKDIKKESF